jgi:hypothetical protein
MTIVQARDPYGTSGLTIRDLDPDPWTESNPISYGTEIPFFLTIHLQRFSSLSFFQCCGSALVSMRIRIRVRIHNFFINADPDPDPEF